MKHCTELAAELQKDARMTKVLALIAAVAIFAPLAVSMINQAAQIVA